MHLRRSNLVKHSRIRVQGQLDTQNPEPCCRAGQSPEPWLGSFKALNPDASHRPFRAGRLLVVTLGEVRRPDSR